MDPKNLSFGKILKFSVYVQFKGNLWHAYFPRASTDKIVVEAVEEKNSNNRSYMELFTCMSLEGYIYN